MTREQKFISQLSDYGHIFTFNLYELDGSAYEIPEAATVTFEAYTDGGAELTITDTAHVTINEGRLSCYYTTQSGDISTEGTYWCRMKINNITSSEAKWIVKGEYPSGE